MFNLVVSIWFDWASDESFAQKTLELMSLILTTMFCTLLTSRANLSYKGTKI